jgi:hypothetical protein
MKYDDDNDNEEYPMKKVPEATPERVLKHREKVGLTQAQAAEVVYLSGYQRWHEYEKGVRSIDKARWELFLLKTGQLDLTIVTMDIS